MTDQALTLKQVETLFQSLTVALTGLDRNKGVRISWPQSGSPDWAISEDVAFIEVTYKNDQITSERHATYSDSDVPGILKKQVGYTRVYQVHWTAYGPNSYEVIAAMQNGLYLDATMETLANSQLYPILEVMQISRQPEVFNGEWWERSDLTWSFNENVVRYDSVPYLTGTSIHIVHESGEEQEVPR